MVCRRCQTSLRPMNGSGFVWSSTARLLLRRYCSPCRAERIVARRTPVLLLGLGVATCSALALSFDGTWLLGWFLGTLLLFQLLCIGVLVPLHELGHAVAGWLAGLEVRRIVLGQGRRIWEGQLGRLRLELRQMPVAGATSLAAKDTRFFRTRMFVAVVAGPLVNVAGAIAIPSPLSPAGALEPAAALGGLMPLAVLWAANWFLLFGSIWPQIVQGPGVPVLSDGAFLWRLLRMSDRDARLMWAATDLTEWRELRDAGDDERALAVATSVRRRHPDLAEFEACVGVSLLECGAPGEARECFLAALDRAATPFARASARSNVAYAHFAVGDDDRRAEADEHSTEAMKTLGEMPAVRATRGSVLVWLGRPDEGIPLLERAFAEYDDVRARAANACSLAIGFAALGDSRGAGRWLDIAARLDPRCPIFERAKIVVYGREPRLMSTGY